MTRSTLPFAINGLGRIGRALLRIARDRPGLELVAVNDVASPAAVAHLIAHDSVHGRYPGAVRAGRGGLELDGRTIPFFDQPDPARIPWREAGPIVVVEATGRFTRRAEAAAHLGGTVERVVLSANSPDADLTLCLGVNDAALDPARHAVVSNASCTTNCLAPVLAVLDAAFGVERALLDTVHCYNNDQHLVDAAHRDSRRARAAARNMIPTTTGAIQAIGRVLPRLDGKVDGFAVRVPTADVSLIDLVAGLAAPAGVDEIAAAFRAAANGPLAGILAVSDEPLVSSDYVGDPHSAIVDLPLLQEVDRRLVRIVAWYDNEWGYASRLADLLERLAGDPEDDAATEGIG